MAPKKPSVDGISEATKKPEEGGGKKERKKKGPSKKKIKTMKTVLIILVGLPYAAFLMWSAALLVMLPDPTGNFNDLILIGQMTSMVGIGVLLFAGFIIFTRIQKAKAFDQKAKIIAAVRGVLFIIPGLLIGGFVPVIITAEPPLTIYITDPVDRKDFIAPVSVTYNLEEAVEILKRRNLEILEYGWDFDGDGNKNETTVVPTTTAVYERAGGYNVVARIKLSDKTERRLVKRLKIPKSVFAYTPVKPIVDEPVRFSVSHLIDDPEQLVEVQWDFDGDGEIDETAQSTDAMFTFRRTEPYEVSATVIFSNQTKQVYKKILEIHDPPPLPFPVKMFSEPEFLVSPPPFGTIFRVETEEKLKGVEWDFGDGEVSEGERVGHTFRDRGTFRVVAQVRNEAGDIATLSKVVRVVDTLKLPDLGFDGEPKVENQKMSGEVPVTVNLEPRTSVPLIEFFWEAPKATVVEEKNTILKAVYRKQGTYIVTLIGQDPDGRVMRLPITLEVTPPSSLMSIRMNPDGGVAPLVVRFDASESVIPGQEISGFVWTFGDEEDKEMAKEAGAQVEHIFENPGTYTVGLKAFTTSGKEFTAEKTIVVRAPILEACFTASRTKGPAPLGVEFNRKCTTGNAVKVLWDFGDGGQSNELTDSVIHVFEKRGEFKVKLSLEDDVGGRSKYMLTITAQ